MDLSLSKAWYSSALFILSSENHLDLCDRKTLISTNGEEELICVFCSCGVSTPILTPSFPNYGSPHLEWHHKKNSAADKVIYITILGFMTNWLKCIEGDVLSRLYYQPLTCIEMQRLLWNACVEVDLCALVRDKKNKQIQDVVHQQTNAGTLFVVLPAPDTQPRMQGESLTLATATKALSIRTPEEINLLPPVPGLSAGLSRGQRAGRSSRKLCNVSLTGCKDKQSLGRDVVLLLWWARDLHLDWLMRHR